jgi:hypothetical protein
VTQFCDARALGNEVSVTSHRSEYDQGNRQPDLIKDKTQDFRFERFQSPTTIKKALQNDIHKSPFKWHQEKDGRRGFVSCTKLCGDWVLAESQQVAVNCTTKEVLNVYLSGDLQERWNGKEVLSCRFRKMYGDSDEEERNNNRDCDRPTKIRLLTRKAFNGSDDISKKDKVITGSYYLQDLVLRSQRVIWGYTGIMRYSQKIIIDKIGHDDYAVLVHLDDDKKEDTITTEKKPFDSLSVYVNVLQRGDDVDIYAAGIMKVNRKVVPNLVIFDASGFAGTVAGKATLWLSGFFDHRRRNKSPAVASESGSKQSL